MWTSHAAGLLDPSRFWSGPALIHTDRLDGSDSQLRRSEPRTLWLSFPGCQTSSDLAGFSSEKSASRSLDSSLGRLQFALKMAFPT
jgi:hypothetical protein